MSARIVTRSKTKSQSDASLTSQSEEMSSSDLDTQDSSTCDENEIKSDISMQKDQENYPSISLVLSWKLMDQRPPWEEISGANKEVKYYWN